MLLSAELSYVLGVWKKYMAQAGSAGLPLSLMFYQAHQKPLDGSLVAVFVFSLQNPSLSV